MSSRRPTHRFPRIVLPTLLILYIVVARKLEAASCSAGPMTAVLGTSCTIGNSVFTFPPVSSGGLPANSVFFTPLDSPQNPGFALSGNFTVPGGGSSSLLFQMRMGISTLSPDIVIDGVGASVAGTNATYSGGFAFAQAQNSNWPCSGECSIATASEGFNSNGSVISRPFDSLPTPPFSDWSFGLVQFSALAQSGGTVSFSAASFHFHESAIGVLNDVVSLTTIGSSFRTTVNTLDRGLCPDGFAGRLFFDANLTNTGQVPLTDLIIRVNELSNGNILENADYVRDGVGAELVAFKGLDKPDLAILAPGESVLVKFSICLQDYDRFTFFVDVLGITPE
jgi:hypothetical protein